MSRKLGAHAVVTWIRWEMFEELSALADERGMAIDDLLLSLIEHALAARTRTVSPSGQAGVVGNQLGDTISRRLRHRLSIGMAGAAPTRPPTTAPRSRCHPGPTPTRGPHRRGRPLRTRGSPGTPAPARMRTPARIPDRTANRWPWRRPRQR
jgi:hypothetical protein